ncbi:hypothetical protein PAGU2196_13790 [Pseudomonas sp. PAGU 2196]|nr:hypothetical protein PAGU2196_13790 [Pseudomonas sp. PAGU 2196]
MLQLHITFVLQAEGKRGLIDVAQHLAEEALMGVLIQCLASGGQHIAKRHGGRQSVGLAGDVRLDFTAHDIQGSMVHHHVVEHQQRHPRSALALRVHQLHQRCLAQVETILARVEARAQLGEGCAASDWHGFADQRRFMPDHLHRLVEVFPVQCGAQDVMALDHPLQRLGEGFQVGFAGEAQLHLRQVRVALGGGQVVVQHALLQRGQRVDVLNVGCAARHAGDDAVDGFLIQRDQRQHVGGYAEGRAEPVVIAFGEHLQQRRLVP